jgi:hypothetical protein
MAHRGRWPRKKSSRTLKPVIRHALRTATGATPFHRMARWLLLALGGLVLRQLEKKRELKKGTGQ